MKDKKKVGVNGAGNNDWNCKTPSSFIQRYVSSFNSKLTNFSLRTGINLGKCFHSKWLKFWGERARDKNPRNE